MRAGTRLADAQARGALRAGTPEDPTDRAQVMALGSQIQVLTQPSQDAGALRAAVENVQPGDSRASYGELARAVRSLADRCTRPSSFTFSATCRNPPCPQVSRNWRCPQMFRSCCIRWPKNAVPNWTVESVNAPGQVWDPKKARVQAVVAGFGTPAATRTVSLVVNGKTVATQAVSMCPPNGRATVEFQSLDVPYGFSRVRSADRFGGRVSRGRCEPVCRGAFRSRGARFLFPMPATRVRRSIFAPRWARRRKPHSRSMPSASDEAANSQLSKYAFVVLSDLISVPAPFESESAESTCRRGGSVWIAEGASAAHAAARSRLRRQRVGIPRLLPHGSTAF